MTLRAVAVTATLLLATACGSKERESAAGPWPHETAGPHAVSHDSFDLTDIARARTLRVHVWWPTTDAPTSLAFEQLLPVGPDRDSYGALLAAAPADCPTRSVSLSPAAELPAAGGPWPLIVFSHCHGCLAISGATIAARLASHGFVVAAPDHTDNTLFDTLDGTGVALSKDFLQTRAADVSFVLDRLLDAGASDVPATIRGALDSSRVGVFGHSFGAVTTGLVLQDDPRPKAGVALAAPMENPLLSGVSMAKISEPVLFVVAREDNSIGEIGNTILRDNFAQGNPPLIKVEIADAGHWSLSDLCAITPDLSAGCGEAQRQTDPSATFSYLPAAQGRAIAAAYVTAFFAAELKGDAAGRKYARAPHPAALVTVDERD